MRRVPVAVLGRAVKSVGPFMLAMLVGVATSDVVRAASAPVVTNVVANQVQGTGFVQVTYDVADADGDSVTVSVIFSSNNGVTYDLLPRTISGDVYTRIAPGTGKSISWNAAADYPGFYWPQVVAKVIANDGQIAAAEMVLVPTGTVNANGTTVTVSGYYIDKYEVTNAEYKLFIDAGGYTTPAYWSTSGWTWRVDYNITSPLNWGTPGWYIGPTYPGFPVAGVSWFEAEAYANFVRKRLPTEAEWHRAAEGSNAGDLYAYGVALNNRRANWLNSGDPNDNAPTPVGYFNGTLYQSIFQTVDSPSPVGTYDMSGNVAEWVRDWFEGSYPSSTVDPVGPSSSSIGRRVVRGGSWSQSDAYTRTETRDAYSPQVDGNSRRRDVGFRLVRPVTSP